MPGPIAGRALLEVAARHRRAPDGAGWPPSPRSATARPTPPRWRWCATSARPTATSGSSPGSPPIDLGVDAVEPAGATPGLTVAQLFLHADIDRDLSRAGAGDNGGVATLLVRLGDALATEPGVGRVLTLSRGTARAALDALTPAEGHLLTPVPLLTEAGSAAQAWPSRVAAERGIRRVLRTHRADVLHLRMAEVGSLAAAEVARELGIPMVFTLAPDPHAVIHALDMTGGLHRGNFGTEDEREHYWFRARLVQRLAEDAGTHRALPPPRAAARHARPARPRHRPRSPAGSPSCRRASTCGSVPRPPPSWNGPERPARRWPSSTRSSPLCPSTAGGCRW